MRSLHACKQCVDSNLSGTVSFLPVFAYIYGMLFATAAKFPLIRDPNSAKSFVSRLGKATAASHQPRFNSHSMTGISRTSLASFKFAAISDGTSTRTTGSDFK